MEETLETLAARMEALGARMDRRFEQVDRRFEQVDRRFEQIEDRFDRLKNETLIGFEEMKRHITLVLERFDDFVKKDATNLAEHRRIDETLEDHDLRILALEHPDTAKRRGTGANKQNRGK